MKRHRTTQDEKNEITQALQGDTGIYIMLLNSVGGDMTKGNYFLKHGNYSPEVIGRKESWDQFYITGEDEGYENGFESAEQVLAFVRDEINGIQEKRTDAIISLQGASVSRWDGVLQAWQLFEEKLATAIEEGNILSPQQAKKIQSQIQN